MPLALRVMPPVFRFSITTVDAFVRKCVTVMVRIVIADTLPDCVAIHAKNAVCDQDRQFRMREMPSVRTAALISPVTLALMTPFLSMK